MRLCLYPLLSTSSLISVWLPPFSRVRSLSHQLTPRVQSALVQLRQALVHAGSIVPPSRERLKFAHSRQRLFWVACDWIGFNFCYPLPFRCRSGVAFGLSVSLAGLPALAGAWSERASMGPLATENSTHRTEPQNLYLQASPAECGVRRLFLFS